MRRLRSAQPNNNFVDRVVVKMLSSNVYEVTLVPFDCGYDFPLFELANGKVCIAFYAKMYVVRYALNKFS